MIITLGANRIRAFDIGEGLGHDSHRIGGMPPEGLAPNSPGSRYLLTMGVDDYLFVSIFLKYDVDFYDWNDLIINREGGAIEIIFHQKLMRSRDARFASNLSSHALILDIEKKDELKSGDDIEKPYSGNKIGGEAYILHKGREGTQLAHSLKVEGFEQFLQLDISRLTPPQGIEFNGELPFGFGIFHLYLKHIASGYDWRCFWEI